MIDSPILQTELSFAELSFYDSYVVCKIKDGININTEKVIALHEIYRDHFGVTNYGYIFDRTTN
ncbi:MAG: hypothetical protein WBM83_10690, partial [Flavobacteriaceae bacterium]